MGSSRRLAVLVFLAHGAGAFAQDQSAPPLVSAEEAAPPPAPSQAPPAATIADDADGRSTWRLHVSLGGGMVASATGGTGTGTGLSLSDAGGWVSVGKPLYEGDRHPAYQWVTDSTILVGYAPGNGRALLVMAPTFGTNFYFGPIFGLEWRAGGGFGATPSVRSNLGIGVVLEASISLRVFSDDRRRIKLQLTDAVVYGFLSGSVAIFTTAGAAVAFETQL